MHWNPTDDLDRVRAERVDVARARPHWPKGATAGVAVAAVTCIGLGILVYQLFGPRDVIGP